MTSSEADLSTMTAAYFDRIGYTGPTTPSLDTLTGLVAAHVRHIPFENLDPLTGTPVADLDRESLHDKLVGRRRGGFCYEHNGLFRHVLLDLGFAVDQLAGRVVWMKEPGPLPAETHQLLSVRVPGQDGSWLVDVGFGGQTPTAPLRFEVGTQQPTDLEPFRITLSDDGLFHVMESKVGGRWQPLYLFTDRARPPVDSVVGSWFASTNPSAPFPNALMVCLIVDDTRWNLNNRHLAVYHADGTREKRELASAAEVLDLLGSRFGIDLAGIEGIEERVAQVVDS
ncbi:arylamine N-acetyltransferase [Gordonia sp. LSe1-13]|uniref:Arylamine N-acetyltransferase n=1 Tax=Gordonia sesuvii TaxID=3116777 RepID=A0ABU7MBN2_9ACTN|nr:arylamine N-acetyltransferase [Gordonia sp. LSe1-13]